MDLRLDVAELLHELLIDLQAARRIDDDDIAGMRLRIINRVLRDRHCIRTLLHREHGDVELLAEDLQLRDGRRAVDVRRDEQRALALLLEREAELASRRRLAGALQADHHDDRRRLRTHVDAALRAAHELRELLVDDLDDDLCRRQRLEDVLANRALLDGLDELLDDLEVDVGFEKCHAHLAHRLIDVILRQLAMAAELLEGCLKSVR